MKMVQCFAAELHLKSIYFNSRLSLVIKDVSRVMVDGNKQWNKATLTVWCIAYLVDYECEKIVSVLLNNIETILDFVELKNRTVRGMHVFDRSIDVSLLYRLCNDGGDAALLLFSFHLTMRVTVAVIYMFCVIIERQ